MRYEDHLARRTTTEARADAAASVVRHAHASVAAVARRQHVRPLEYLDSLVDDLSSETESQTQP
jgi:hypothetical protein